MTELAKTPYKAEFQYICVEKTPRAQLPNWLKQTPTLLIRSDQEEPIKTNAEVMNWLFMRKMQDNGGSSGSGGGHRESPGAAGPQGAPTGDPEAWNMSEMGGKLSDSYGSIVDGNSATVDSSSTKNFDFTWLGGNAAPGDRTMQGIGDSMRQEPSRTKSKKEEMMDKQYEQFMKSRDQGMPQVRPRAGGAGGGGGGNLPPGGSMGGFGPGMGGRF